MDSKKLTRLCFVLGLLAFLVNGDNYASSPLLIKISEDYNIRIDVAALSVTSYMLMFGFLTIIIGALGDKYGKMKVIFWSALGTSVFSIVCVFARNINSLIVFRALNGAFASGVLPVSVALIGELAPSDKKQNMIGKVMGMMFFGGAVATSIGGGLSYFGSWKLVYLVYGVAEFLLTVVVFSSIKEFKTQKSTGSVYKNYKEALVNKQLQKMLLLLFFMGYSVLGSFVYTGKLMEIKTGYNVLVIGLLLGFFGLGTILAGRKSGSIRLKLGNYFFPLVGLIGFGTLLALSLSVSVILLCLSLLVFGAVFIAFQSSFITISQSILPQIRGTVMSLASFCVVIGGSVGTLVNGLLLNELGIRIIFNIVSGLLLVISILAFLFIKSITIKN